MSAISTAEIRLRLLEWYRLNQRALPWRGDATPYETFVSEIMLQQTGVERVRSVFERFVETFPGFEQLADAPTVDVLRAWAGLGYNRRAIRLQECARIISRDFGGVLPRDPKDLARLPGVGSYTVAAIRSFVYHEDVVALDTNVRRVIGRICYGTNVSDREIRDTATTLVPPGLSATWNQTLMDFGSLQCTVEKPRCGICPVREYCAWVTQGSVGDVPRRIAEKSEPYAGSRRFIRGRIVAFVRELPITSLVPLSDLTAYLYSNGISDDDAIRELVTSMAKERLCRVVPLQTGLLLGTPA